MYYTEIDAETLLRALPGITLLERIRKQSGEEVDTLILYGITRDHNALDSAAEAVRIESEDMADSDEQAAAAVDHFAEIAVAIPLGSDDLVHLLRSGLILREETFAYLGGSDGVRTLRFNGRGAIPRLKAESFTALALATSDSYLDDFLTEKGHAPKAQAPVERTENAVVAKRKRAPKKAVNSIDRFLAS